MIGCLCVRDIVPRCVFVSVCVCVCVCVCGACVCVLCVCVFDLRMSVCLWDGLCA